jgi:hypothetical protein
LSSTRITVFCVGLLALGGMCRAEDASSAFHSRVSPVLQSHCIKCHGPQKQKAKINFATARGLEQLAADRDLWFRVVDKVEAGEMPPDDEPKLSAAERQSILGWVRGDYVDLLVARQRQEGRSRLRRLSRTEYANTIQDLFGVRPTVGLNLPEDGRVDGYDKVSAALPLSASGAGGYLRMTEDLLKLVLYPVPPPKAPLAAAADGPFDPNRTVRLAAQESGQSPGHSLRLPDDTIVSFNSDTTSGRFDYSTRIPGMHRVRLSVYAYQTDKPMPFGVYVGHTAAYPQILDRVKVLQAPPGQPAVIETEIYLRTRDFNDRAPVGDGIRLIPFGIGVQVPKNSLAKLCKGPGLACQWMEVEEPELPLAGDRWLTADFPKALNQELRRSRTLPPEQQVVMQKPGAKYQAKSVNREEFLAIMRSTFARVGARVYRRDLTPAELDAIIADIARQIDAGDSLDSVFLNEVTEMLTSPDFLCVIEPPGKLSDFALASRLSYFLWNSTPDEELLDLARQGRLSDDRVLHDQTERLLNDHKSARFVTDFVDQWLGLRGLDDTSPDHNLYPEYDEFLKLSSAAETEGFFRIMLDENLGVKNFVASDWAYVNDRLARHYGLPDVAGPELRKVPLPPESPYGGLWTQSAVLKVTANGTNTSPVKRGRWVAERLLGTPIPPPPPSVKPIEPDTRGAKTLRQQLALHRGSGSTCAACHAKFDPYGFALESFDVTGGFRTHYREAAADVLALPTNQRAGRPTWRDGLPVDCTGQTPDGRSFADINELRRMLAANPEQLARGVGRHLVTYATGAPPTPLDDPAIERMVKAAEPNGYGLRSLVHAVVQSELFRWK